MLSQNLGRTQVFPYGDASGRYTFIQYCNHCESLFRSGCLKTRGSRSGCDMKQANGMHSPLFAILKVTYCAMQLPARISGNNSTDKLVVIVYVYVYACMHHLIELY
jgi:hypothetical protein